MRDAGLRRTRARVALLEVLFAARRPLTHGQIQRRLSDVEVNRVTIYRTLDALREVGLVHRLESPDRLWRFGVCGDRHHGHCHPHFTCRVCGKVECLRELPMPVCDEPSPGYRLEHQQLYMTGVCAGCGGKTVGESAPDAVRKGRSSTC